MAQSLHHCRLIKSRLSWVFSLYPVKSVEGLKPNLASAFSESFRYFFAFLASKAWSSHGSSFSFFWTMEILERATQTTLFPQPDKEHP